ncbi:dolichyl-diphosphooligosaccharide--protein glycosyltransferase subunit 2 [Lingula anatina]|uniref:Dolichyl-diphosphooligosaccharide--protein glycosyltransferase subunit 2 n=1 Tax=Lingula anatina TaxID=7574 RepID=A0A1S3IX76_LINAN|nr:dolichyl-diphosphooligosaccharide--protein glycosyltransferase subunit 2 [Lingula anatina]|eukprot:XP_013402149.1 dolichyl-diphosphooligosaccharide--protein glycosyltransferase subunit 2 [Lingula anatina]
MARGTVLLVAFALLSVMGQALTPSSYFSAADQARLRSVFEAAAPYSDVEAAHYSIMGLKLLGVVIPNSKDVCNYLQVNLDQSSVESLFFASSAAKNLGGCQLTANTAKETIAESLKTDQPVVNIFYAILAAKNLGVTVDSAKASQTLLEVLKKDDSPLSLGYAFLAATQLSGDVSKFFDRIEDVVAQADEVDDKYLQFEGGLFTTSVVIDSAYKLATKVNKAPTIDEEKIIKFTNYFLSRKSVQQLKTAAHLLSAVKTLTDNKFHIPVAVTLASPVAVSASSPKVKVRVSNLLGVSLGAMTVTADTGRNLGDDAVVLSKKQFTPAADDKAVYELDFMQTKPSRGFYSISISLSSQKADKRLVGTSGAEVHLKVTTQVGVENVEIGVADKDQGTPARTTKVQHPKKASSTFEADHHQRIIMRFTLRDMTANAAMTAHQTFVRLTNQKSKQEIVFVAEADNADVYRFDLDVGSSAKDFGWLSGKYTMDLVVGDAVIENPLFWTVADVSLTFPEGSAPKAPASDLYAPKKNIEHMFRQPEKRPPGTVSMLFTALVLAPAALLLILWLTIGVNISNFPMSLSAIGFHAGLGAIFVLYYFYWVHLNMFQTLRYLGFLGVPTFLFGNRLLSGIAAKRKSS